MVISLKKRRENPDKKKEIINKYDASSDYYERRYSEIQYKKYEIVLKDFILRDKVILDAGCGTGLLLDYIISSIEKTKSVYYSYIAIDISINMLKIFKSKNFNKDKKISNKLNLVLSDLENLPLRGTIVNSVLSLTSLQNLPHINDGVKEMLRVAKDEIKISILKKKLDLNQLISLLKPRIYNLEIIDKKTIEDIIIQGKKVKT